MFIRIFALTLLLLILGLGVGFWVTDPTARHRPTVERVTMLFDHLAFSGFGEHGPNGKGPRLRRFAGPVEIVVMGPEHTAMAGYLENYAIALSEVRNLEVSVVAHNAYTAEPEAQAALMNQGNLQVVSIPPEELVAFIEAGDFDARTAGQLTNGKIACLTLGAERVNIPQALVFIRAGLDPGKRNACLAKEVAFAIGIHIEDKNFFDIFESRPEGPGLSPVGRFALGLIYNETLPPGLPRAEGLAAARAMLEAKGLPVNDQEAQKLQEGSGD